MKLIKLLAATLSLFALGGCVAGAIVPVPVDTSPTYSYYSERYYYPNGVNGDFYRYP